MSRTLLLCVVSLAVGAGLGWTLHGSDETAVPLAPSSAIATHSATSQRPIEISSSAIDVSQLRAVIREELAAVAGNGGTATVAIKESLPTPELVAKRRVAAEEIETMIRGGEWGNEQRLAFHQRIGMLDAEQGARLLREVTMALNNGTLQMTTDGAPL